MKSFSRAVIVLLAVVGITVAAAPAWATLIAYDPFGTSGNLNGTATGSGFSAGWVADTYYKLGTPSLTPPIGGLPVDGGYTYQATSGAKVATRALSTSLSPTSGNTWYLSWDFGRSNGPNPWSGAGIRIDTAGTKMIDAGINTVGGLRVIQVGIHDGAGTWIADPGTVEVDTTPRLYVMKIATQATGTVDVYLNTYLPTDTLPTKEPATWDLHVTATGLSASYSYVGLRGDPKNNTVPFKWDEFRIGTTWGDVAAVPEPSTLALLACGLIGLLAYAWRKRR